MKRIKRYGKLILLDTIGLVFIIASIALGWLPGPGGIPLLLVGLSFLAINHEWAERLINLIKEHGNRLADIIFVNNPKLQLAYDFFAPVSILAGIYIGARFYPSWWSFIVGLFLVVTGISFLLGNRQRLKHIEKWFKR